jgi:hypothetical protein
MSPLPNEGEETMVTILPIIRGSFPIEKILETTLFRD